jgi:hypothetical protein
MVKWEYCQLVHTIVHYESGGKGESVLLRRFSPGAQKKTGSMRPKSRLAPKREDSRQTLKARIILPILPATWMYMLNGQSVSTDLRGRTLIER